MVVVREEDGVVVIVVWEMGICDYDGNGALFLTKSFVLSKLKKRNSFEDTCHIAQSEFRDSIDRGCDVVLDPSNGRSTREVASRANTGRNANGYNLSLTRGRGNGKREKFYLCYQ